MITDLSRRAFTPGATSWISQWLERMLLSSTLRKASSETPDIGPK